MDPDLAFRAPADPSRGALLDRLFAQSGLTLAELTGGLVMSRQAIAGTAEWPKGK